LREDRLNPLVLPKGIKPPIAQRGSAGCEQRGEAFGLHPGHLRKQALRVVPRLAALACSTSVAMRSCRQRQKSGARARHSSATRRASSKRRLAHSVVVHQEPNWGR
jgi:hypothetical protein